MTQYSKIEEIAKVLLQMKISFSYNVTSLEVLNSDFPARYFSYHNQTGKLVAMDSDYNEVAFGRELVYSLIKK
jgi:hypothetical protein